MRVNVIKCPHCGYEYLPGEIYIGKTFIGCPENITRNSIGEVIDYVGDMSTTEYYQCDNCDTHFKITSTVTFTETEITEEEYVNEAIKPKFTKKELF